MQGKLREQFEARLQEKGTQYWKHTLELQEKFKAQLQEKWKQYEELTLEKNKIEAQRREQETGAEIQAQEGTKIKDRVQEKKSNYPKPRSRTLGYRQYRHESVKKSWS